jgi:acyl-CoA synthetase (AMP-forming)/AMP-acid ligase II
MLQQKLGSIGIPIPGGKFYLIDEKHQIFNELNVEGELVYEGENVCMGYARDCYDLAKGDLNKGVLETGDIAKADPDGYYYITGRKKRFLKLFGNRISLDQIEQKINEAGYDCACVGVDDQMKIYTTRESYVQKIKDYIVKYFGINKSGFSIICIDTIPRNDSGKILYSELEKN